MPEHAMSEVVAALRASWGRDTCDPVDVPTWSPGNPARGQCGVTALVLNDLVGGQLLIADVVRPDGSRQGVHYWNQLPDGTQLDLTLEQFAPDEVVQAPRLVPRPPGPPKRCHEQYQLLRSRVLERLR